tara:strand:- start:5965 stop:7404 length:1440 start_codon:yes stop_codon:yes gene_type:complete
MKLINFLLLCCILISSHKTESAAIAFNSNLASIEDPPIFGPVHPQYAIIQDSYRALQGALNLNLDFSTALHYVVQTKERLKFSMNFRPIAPGAIPPDYFTTRLRNIYINLNNFINQGINPAVPAADQLWTQRAIQTNLKYAFRGVMNSVLDRYILAIIENKNAENEANIGQRAFDSPSAGVINGIPNGPAGAAGDPELYRRTLKILTGKIFVVKPIAGGGSQIIGVASGMLIPKNLSGTVISNEVLTCAHSLRSQVEDYAAPDLEFYFIRSEALDLNTGLPPYPTVSRILGDIIPPGYTQDHLIAYLRTSSRRNDENDVRRIESFKVKNHGEASKIEHHIPNYHTPNEDCGIGKLNNFFAFPIRRFARIHVHNAGDIDSRLHPAVAAPYRYFALGYPAFIFYPPAAGTFSTPAVLTQTENTAGAAQINRIGGLLQIQTPIARGMSGGPVFYIDQATQTIGILGVIQSVGLDQYNACIAE